MIRVFRIAGVCVLAALLVQAAAAQESKSAKATREKLKQKASVDAKEQGTKSIFDELLSEAEKPIRFKIDNVSGISNNSKLTFKGKGTIEELLNQMSDKFDFGWYVYSNEGNNKEDGKIVIRKNTDGKERGTEFKKKKASVPPRIEGTLPREYTLDLPTLTRSPQTLLARLRD
jgi:hypothetical protein